MRINNKIKAFVVTTLLTLSSVPMMGQDLLARHAPVDRKMKTVDTLALRDLLIKELAQSPSAELYEDWNNQYAHRATALPDTFKINLRNFCMPTPSRVVTSNFGARWGRMHKGLDIKVYIGDTIRAAFSGKVRIVRYEAKGYGKYVVIRHNNGLETIYGHLSKHLVTENQEVKAGDVIGLGGNTGRSTGSHLHFETRLCGVALNPAIFFDFRNQDVTADYYVFNKSTYDRDSQEANRLRGKIGNGGYTREQVLGKSAPGNKAVAATEVQKAAKNDANKQYHKVAKGETLYSIARKRGTTVEELCKLNHIGKDMRVMPGQMLRYS
jgi:LysM repeat protein